MTTKDLKNRIMSKVKSLNNETLLREISKLLEIEEDLEEVYKISEEQLLVVEEGLEQLDKGQFLTHEEANAEIEEWLKKSDGQ